MNQIETVLKQGLEEFKEDFYSVMALEVDPKGNDEMYLIRNEDGIIESGIDFREEREELQNKLKTFQKDLLDAVVAEVKGKRQDNLPSSLQDPSGFCSGMGHNLALTDIETLINNSTGV